MTILWTTSLSTLLQHFSLLIQHQQGASGVFLLYMCCIIVVRIRVLYSVGLVWLVSIQCGKTSKPPHLYSTNRTQHITCTAILLHFTIKHRTICHQFRSEIIVLPIVRQHDIRIIRIHIEQSVFRYFKSSVFCIFFCLKVMEDRFQCTNKMAAG